MIPAGYLGGRSLWEREGERLKWGPTVTRLVVFPFCVCRLSGILFSVVAVVVGRHSGNNT